MNILNINIVLTLNGLRITNNIPGEQYVYIVRALQGREHILGYFHNLYLDHADQPTELVTFSVATV